MLADLEFGQMCVWHYLESRQTPFDELEYMAQLNI